MGLMDSINDFLDGDPNAKLERLKTKSAILDMQMEIEDKKRALKDKKLKA